MTTLETSSPTLQERLEYTFKDPALLEKALTHRSFANEAKAASETADALDADQVKIEASKENDHNERLEFLGDAVIDLSLSDLLMKTYPELREGDLSKLRASLVNETFLAERAIELEIPAQMRLGKGEEKSGGAEKPRLVSSVLEALIGAIYLEAGFETSHKIVERIFVPHFKELQSINELNNDYKTQLQEKTQRSYKQIPRYKVVSEEGPDHDKTFEVSLSLANKEFSRGQGKSKKIAEQMAAKYALELLESGKTPEIETSVKSEENL